MCDCNNILSVSGKTSDLCHVSDNQGNEIEGYVPDELNIGGGDYLNFSFCADCGKIQGCFPVQFPKKENE